MREPISGPEARPRLNGLHHVKVPVADVARSRDWYAGVFDLETELEFVEGGCLAGVSLRDADRTLRLALRADSARARALAGFDAVALGVHTRAALDEWAMRLEGLGHPHRVESGRLGWVISGLRDPDGIEVRLYTIEEHGGKR
ncbi:MAG TPA: VOC family protein [Acidimicrobiales bacterium]|jgi:catechol 2,3-dioxygenase-like lactoylglutathione lyase family enzyme|nr:VOC family protein [Acidimicrobiales bacterium]HWI02707.1 VOC family protein [Acidimicrobiales bacterium]